MKLLGYSVLLLVGCRGPAPASLGTARERTLAPDSSRPTVLAEAGPSADASTMVAVGGKTADPTVPSPTESTFCDDLVEAKWSLDTPVGHHGGTLYVSTHPGTCEAHYRAIGTYFSGMEFKYSCTCVPNEQALRVTLDACAVVQHNGKRMPCNKWQKRVQGFLHSAQGADGGTGLQMTFDPPWTPWHAYEHPKMREPVMFTREK